MDSRVRGNDGILFLFLISHPISYFLKLINVINIFPIEQRDDLEVDFLFDIKPRPVYLFGVKDNSSARLTALSCLEFQKVQLPFKSFVVHEDFENLSRKDKTRITSAADTQFVTLDDFRDNAIQVLEREIA